MTIEWLEGFYRVIDQYQGPNEVLVMCWDFWVSKYIFGFVLAGRTTPFRKRTSKRRCHGQMELQTSFQPYFTHSRYQYGGPFCFGAESICPLEFQDSHTLLPPPTLNINCKTTGDSAGWEWPLFQNISVTNRQKLCPNVVLLLQWYHCTVIFAFSLYKSIRLWHYCLCHYCSGKELHLVIIPAHRKNWLLNDFRL